MKRLIHPFLKEILSVIDPLEQGHKIRVKLRNSRFEITEKKVCALILFFDHFPKETPLFFEAIDFLMEWVTENKDDPDIECALIEKKWRLSIIFIKPLIWPKDRIDQDARYKRRPNWASLNCCKEMKGYMQLTPANTGRAGLEPAPYGRF